MTEDIVRTTVAHQLDRPGAAALFTRPEIIDLRCNGRA